MERRIDNTGFGGIRILQNPEEFCYGVDAVLLADMAAKGAVKAKAENCIDLGTGTGIIPLVMSHKSECRNLIGVEIQSNSFETALENAELNNLNNRIKFINEDVHNIASGKCANLNDASFDIVTTNPPYTEENGGVLGKNKAKAIARHETTANLEDFIKSASRLLKDKGNFYMVHRPSRLVDVCELCRKHKLEPKEIQFISGKPLEKPNIMLIHCVRNGNRELNFLNPVFVHKENGEYSEYILKLYEK